MITLSYPSGDFIRAFDAALDKKTAFDIAVSNGRKRTAISRTMKRIHAEPVDDRILVSLFDKLSLWDFYPGLASAIAAGIYTIALYEGNEQLTITFRVCRRQPIRIENQVIEKMRWGDTLERIGR